MRKDYETFTVILGGLDLEMYSIKMLCKKNNIHYIETPDLNWGNAKLDFVFHQLIHNTNSSKLKDTKQTIVSIELENNMNALDVIEIDHHNQNSYKESSLKQFINFFDLTEKEIEKCMNLEEVELISANDTGGQSGMEDYYSKIGSPINKEMIKKIRRKERSIMRNDREYENIKKEIKESRKFDNNTLIIDCKTSKSTLYLDALYEENVSWNTILLLCENEHEYNFYQKEGLEFVKSFNDSNSNWRGKNFAGGIGFDFESIKELVSDITK